MVNENSVLQELELEPSEMYALMLAFIAFAWAMVVTGRAANILDQIERMLGANRAGKPNDFSWYEKIPQRTLDKLRKLFWKQPVYVPPNEFSDDSEPEFQ